MEINRDLIRWAILIGAAPIWWPFVKTLWLDFNRALREEGGLFGREPAGRELEILREERRKEPESLVSEPWVKPGDVRRPRLRSRGEQSRAGKTARPRGFGR